MTKTIYALALLLCGTAAFAQPALPSPPSSPVPVLNFQYDAQGNLKTSTQVIGTGTAGFSTQGDYDRLNRLRAVIDAKSGLTTLDYDGFRAVSRDGWKCRVLGCMGSVVGHFCTRKHRRVDFYCQAAARLTGAVAVSFRFRALRAAVL